MRVRGMAFALIVALVLSAFVMTSPQARAAANDQVLGGRIYLCDGTFLGNTNWSDTTQFNIMVQRGGTFTNYTTTTTEGGLYSFVLPWQEKGTFWDDGDPYWVFVDGSPWGGLATTYLSFGNGSFGNGSANFGQQEWTPLGSVNNTINWDGSPGQPDNWQWWDIQENCADLIPVDIEVDGAAYPVAPGGTGPCRIVGFGDTVLIAANVSNVGPVFVGLSTNITFFEGATFLDESLVPPVGVGATVGPYFANWTAPFVPGTFFVNITVDFPVPGLIVESSETNNTVTVCLRIQGPDLTPWDVTIATNTTTTVYPNTMTDAVMIVSLGDLVFMGGWVRNVGWVDATSPFYLNLTDSSATLNWTLVPSLEDNSTDSANVTYSFIASPIGIYDFWITADSSGAIVEADELNNTRLIRIIVRGPDLIPADVSVDTTTYADDSSPQMVTATLGQSYWIASWARNVGFDNVSAPFTINIVNETGLKAAGHFDPPLLVGGMTATNVSYVWTATFIGVSCFDFIVDPWNNVTEMEEANNTFRVCFTSGGPDLRPDPILGDGQSPAQAIPGQLVNITGTVTNFGGQSTVVPFRAVFYNGTCAQQGSLQAFFDLPPLSPAETSSVISFQWPAASVGTFFVSLWVDTEDAVVETNENNNCDTLTIVVGGFPDLVPTNVAVSGAAYTGPVDLPLGRTVEVATQVENVGLVDSGVFGPSFLVVIMDDSDGSEVGNTTFTGSVVVGGTTTETFNGYWTAPLAAGTYTLTAYADWGNAIPEGDEANNAIVLTFDVHALVAPPSPVVVAGPSTDTVDWTDNPGPPEAVAYNVYGGSDPLAINFTAPLNTAPVTATSFDLAPPSGEFYYIVRSLDVRGWEGPSSGVVGRYAKSFPQGYSTFSLPLEPFGTVAAHDLAGAGGIMAGDTDGIFRYDSDRQAWEGHAAGMPASVHNFELVVGHSYMVFLNSPAEFVFVGRPGADIRFLDFPGDPRVGASAGDADFRTSLQLTAVGDAVQVDWSPAQDLSGPLSPFEVPASYRVYRAAQRGGPYVLIGEVSVVTFIDQNVTAGEYYYRVAPVNSFGREGSSTFAAGIVWVSLGRGYTAFGLHFSSAETTVTDFMADNGVGDPAVVFAYQAREQRWVGHTAAMPRGLAEFTVAHSEGYYINLMHGGVVLVVTGR